MSAPPLISHWPSQRTRPEPGCHDGDGTVAVFRPFDRHRTAGPWGQVDFIDLVVLPAGSSIGRHRHGNNQEWYVILKGEGRMWLDGAWQAVRPGDTLVNPPQGEHELRNETEQPIELLVFQLSPSEPR